ncbi:sensor histidine kinase [Pediococcus ethanolidurans]|uniref:histidine kinase n=1 Tax=Pediococcus ethanolidurans TaxID=319653 RepID=A0A1H9P5F4_9LACO|nr:ATP-binding protein [Pediococcus ethanolidurans]GEN94753.1 two-component sensor histidine kinase [Pediococcus ethanolidurans]SER43412.1 two-component system, OmpR family, phosphate regulon sensor histidine kinase PhoR [Pediococcus ethanolidurans]
MNSIRKKMLNRTLRFFLTTFIGNLLMAFLVLKAVQKGQHSFSAREINYVLLFAITIFVTAIEVVVYWSNLRQSQLRQAALNEKLQEVLKGEKASQIVLPKDDPFYELTMTVNQIESHDRHQIHNLTNQGNELKAIVNNLPVGVLVINRHREVQLANPATVDLLQLQIKTDPHPYTMDINQNDLQALIERTFETKRSHHRTIHLKREPSEKVVEATVVYNKQVHHHFEVIVLLYDITEAWTVEQMQLNFVSNASHELRTPITAISGFAETLMNGAKNDPDKLDEFLRIIQKESRKLVRLADDILSISRTQSGGEQSLKIADCNLAALGQEEIKLLHRGIQLHQVEVSNQIPENVKVQTDAQQLGQIIKNLVANGIRYNRPHGHVKLSYEEVTNRWKLIVEDDGIGIAPEEQHKVFERFYRVNANKPGELVSGTGLGLPIVAESVKNLGGEIRLKSEPGKGSQFILTFPKEWKPSPEY